MATVNLNQEQLAYIRGLEVRTVKVSGRSQKIACDFEKKTAYFLDSANNPTGQATHLSDENIASLMKRQAEESHSTPEKKDEKSSGKKPEPSSGRKTIIRFLRKLAGATEEEINGTSDSKQDTSKQASPQSDTEETQEQDPEQEKGKKKANAKTYIVVSVAVIAIITAGTAITLKNISHPGGGDATASSSIQSSKSLNTIEVIQATQDLIPGDAITSENIQKATISAEAYNQISLASVSLYQWSRSDSLIDAYAVSYIPKGQYLTYNNVNTVYSQKSNPWGKPGDGYKFISLPIQKSEDAQEVNYGSVVNLTIVKKTVKETGNTNTDDADKQEIAGLDHKTSVQQSSIVDTYLLSDVVVCDLLDSDKNSLYETLTAWMDIPAGEQPTYIKTRFQEDESLMKELEPKYMQLRVTAEQAEALGSLTDDVTITIEVQNKSDTGNDAKKLYAAEAKALRKSITTISQELSGDTSDDTGEDAAE